MEGEKEEDDDDDAAAAVLSALATGISSLTATTTAGGGVAAVGTGTGTGTCTSPADGPAPPPASASDAGGGSKSASSPYSCGATSGILTAAAARRAASDARLAISSLSGCLGTSNLLGTAAAAATNMAAATTTPTTAAAAASASDNNAAAVAAAAAAAAAAASEAVEVGDMTYEERVDPVPSVDRPHRKQQHNSNGLKVDAAAAGGSSGRLMSVPPSPAAGAARGGPAPDRPASPARSEPTPTASSAAASAASASAALDEPPATSGHRGGGSNSNSKGKPKLMSSIRKKVGHARLSLPKLNHGQHGHSSELEEEEEEEQKAISIDVDEESGEAELVDTAAPAPPLSSSSPPSSASRAKMAFREKFGRNGGADGGADSGRGNGSGRDDGGEGRAAVARVRHGRAATETASLTVVPSRGGGAGGGGGSRSGPVVQQQRRRQPYHLEVTATNSDDGLEEEVRVSILGAVAGRMLAAAAGSGAGDGGIANSGSATATATKTITTTTTVVNGSGGRKQKKVVERTRETYTTATATGSTTADVAMPTPSTSPASSSLSSPSPPAASATASAGASGPTSGIVAPASRHCRKQQIVVPSENAVREVWGTERTDFARDCTLKCYIVEGTEASAADGSGATDSIAEEDDKDNGEDGGGDKKKKKKERGADGDSALASSSASASVAATSSPKLSPNKSKSKSNGSLLRRTPSKRTSGMGLRRSRTAGGDGTPKGSSRGGGGSAASAPPSAEKEKPNDPVPSTSYTPSSGTKFACRVGPNYKKTGKKSPSLDGLYEIGAVRMFRSEKRTGGSIIDVMPLPLEEVFGKDGVSPWAAVAGGTTSGDDGDGGDGVGNVGDAGATNNAAAAADVSVADHVPDLLIFHVQMPHDSPSMFKPTDDGRGAEAVFYYKPTERFVREMMGRKPMTPASQLFARWCQTSNVDPAMRSRFKCMALVRNLESHNLGWLKPYNGKPVLITESGTARRGVKDGVRYVEMSANVHKWGFVAKKGFVSLIPRFKELRLDVGFTIEAQTDYEMPECILGAVGVNFIDENELATISPAMQESKRESVEGE